jgi:hypothetical protein
MWMIIRGWLINNIVRIALWGGAAALSVAAVLLSARRAGRNAERTTQLVKTLEVKNAQLRATISAPRTRGELVDQLRHGKF